MAARRKRAARKTVRRTNKAAMPGWVWMLFGLVVGLSVAAAIYVGDRRDMPQAKAPAVPAEQPRPASDVDPEPVETPASRYSFYDMLPTFEVVIPENEFGVKSDSAAALADKPGIYVLQAGSFSRHADADRRKAQLGLLGIVSQIQKVSVDDDVWYRVRIGPIDDLPELRATGDRLRQAKVEFMVIRVGD